jgi:hypothetical protein
MKENHIEKSHLRIKELNTEKDISLPGHIFSFEHLHNISYIELNETINEPISLEEIKTCIKSLKRNKSCSSDNIFNEYILKSSSEHMLPLYNKLFDKIFDSGVFSFNWLCGQIIPLYKNKGNAKDPKNYRPVTLFLYWKNVYFHFE